MAPVASKPANAKQAGFMADLLKNLTNSPQKKVSHKLSVAAKLN